MTHWAMEYIGLPWSSEFDCWGFFRHVQRERFGRNLPAIRLEDYRLPAKSKMISTHPERANWKEIETPEEGDGALMLTGNRDAHVGIYVDIDGGRILHSDQPLGGMLTPVDRLREDYTHIKFYRYHAPAD
jgi:cell wall-associated NlpC family hydrolase